MNPEIVTVRVIDALQAAGFPYMLVGSFSSNFYGIPRSTEDVDFVLQVESNRMEILLRLLGPDFVADPQLSFEAVTGTFRQLLKFQGNHFKIELFFLSSDAHDQERWRRRRTVALCGREVSLPSPEDVIITKLRWARGKDEDDVKGILAVQQATLDWPYLRSWCDRHGTRDKLERLRQAVSPP